VLVVAVRELRPVRRLGEAAQPDREAVREVPAMQGLRDAVAARPARLERAALDARGQQVITPGRDLSLLCGLGQHEHCTGKVQPVGIKPRPCECSCHTSR